MVQSLQCTMKTVFVVGILYEYCGGGVAAYTSLAVENYAKRSLHTCTTYWWRIPGLGIDIHSYIYTKFDV